MRQSPGVHSKEFAGSVTTAVDVYDAENLEACAQKCEELLDEPDVPVYFQIKALILLGACYEDASDCSECYRKVDGLLIKACKHHSDDESVKEPLAELQDSLGYMYLVLKEKAERRHDDDDDEAEEDYNAMVDATEKVEAGTDEAEEKVEGSV